MVVGVLSGVLIFLFKLASSAVMHLSEQIYGFVRQNPVYLPALILGVAAIGVVSALILKYAKECRGGGSNRENAPESAGNPIVCYIYICRPWPCYKAWCAYVFFS